MNPLESLLVHLLELHTLSVIDVPKLLEEEERMAKDTALEITVDQVNHPAHYTAHPSGIEAIQITRHMNFNLGNAIKYIWRAGIKNEGKHIEDLKKAIFYINDEIKRIEGNI